MRKKIVAANWKMNLTYAEAMALTDALVDAADDYGNCSVILSAPFVYLHDIISRIQSHPYFSVSAQNCSEHEKGAYTGEVSAMMLASIGVEHVIIGHSERRTIYKETDEQIASKVSKVVSHGLLPVFCCGETLDQRKSGNHFKTVESQLKKGIFHLGREQMKECVIAYEPVWAIGTGVNATSAQAQEMHAFIRSQVADKYGEAIASEISILYGGSVNPGNADELFACADVDGGLVGGASLKSADFLSIIQSMITQVNVNQ